jgi:hypothetical protein
MLTQVLEGLPLEGLPTLTNSSLQVQNWVQIKLGGPLQCIHHHLHGSAAPSQIFSNTYLNTSGCQYCPATLVTELVAVHNRRMACMHLTHHLQGCLHAHPACTCASMKMRNGTLAVMYGCLAIAPYSVQEERMQPQSWRCINDTECAPFAV